ncbi:MAG: ATP-dependent DNA helicase RecG [Alphaproteobacteria bacterium]
MRPAILFPLFAPVTSLPGVGPRLGKLLEKLCGPHITDLLWHRPFAVIDRAYRPTIAEAEPGRTATLAVRIAEHIAPKNPRLPYRIVAYDTSSEQITLNFFNTQAKYLTEQYPANVDLLISGRVELYRGEKQMSHPDFVAPAAEAEKIPLAEPVYGLTEGLNGKQMRRFIAAALEKLPAPPEWIDPHLMAARQWPEWSAALRQLHNPASPDDLAPAHPARQRLAYDELLANQMAMMIYRRNRGHKGRAFQATGKFTAPLLASLSFKLTDAQERCRAEIAGAMSGEDPMLRLLQGDVGSGKTVVALLAMLQAAEAGSQAALLAPTEILAKQHCANLRAMLQPIGIEIGLLTGKINPQDKRAVTAALADGTLSLVVGTHALIQDDVAFHDLGLVVIDEQHRFGVQQRAQLAKKGRGVDILAMTATPIPRTLMLTAYGDMEASLLDEKPPGRQPIDTRAVDIARLGEVIAGLERHVASGRQAYWVCPLVEESELIDLANVKDRAALLAAQLGANAVGLIHGQMPVPERDAIMARFAAGELKALVATTVIEVGIDVPNSTLMVVEHAERFGLAQLHQLRGRVGRGDDRSVCLLLYQGPLGEAAKARLKMIRETEDGFRIAEEDLRLRGPGEMLGTRQSGAPEYKLADLAAHYDLLAVARDDARLVLDKDPALQSPRGQAMRILLYPVRL